MIDQDPFKVLFNKIDQQKQLDAIVKGGYTRSMGTELAKVSQMTYGSEQPIRVAPMPTMGLKPGWGGGS